MFMQRALWLVWVSWPEGWMRHWILQVEIYNRLFPVHPLVFACVVAAAIAVQIAMGR